MILIARSHRCSSFPTHTLGSDENRGVADSITVEVEIEPRGGEGGRRGGMRAAGGSWLEVEGEGEGEGEGDGERYGKEDRDEDEVEAVVQD